MSIRCLDESLSDCKKRAGIGKILFPDNAIDVVLGENKMRGESIGRFLQSAKFLCTSAFSIAALFSVLKVVMSSSLCVLDHGAHLICLLVQFCYIVIQFGLALAETHCMEMPIKVYVFRLSVT